MRHGLVLGLGAAHQPRSFANCRIWIRHDNSLGTVVSGKTATGTTYPVPADSTPTPVTGQPWQP